MKRLGKNILSLSLSDIVKKMLGFLSIAYLTRHITVADFGMVNIGLTILSYILIISAAGIPAYGARTTARGISSQSIGELLSVRLFNSFALLLLADGIAFYFFRDSNIRLLTILFSFSAIPNALFLDWYFQGKESMGVLGVSRMVSALCYLLVILLLVHGSTDVQWIALAAIIGDIASTLILFLKYQKIGETIRLSFTPAVWIKVMKDSMPFGIGTILAQCSLNFAPILIGLMLTMYDVGVFSAGSKFVFFLLLFDRVLATIFLPGIARIQAQTPELFQEKVAETISWVFIIALPICAGGMFVSAGLMSFVYGAEYQAASLTFQAFVWFLLLTMLNSVFSYSLIGLGEEKTYARVTFYSAILYLVLIIAGILFLGAPGAALGMILADGISVVMMKNSLNRFVKILMPKKVVQVILSVILMIVGMALLPPLHVIIVIGLGGLFYFVALFITRAILPSEISALIARVK